MVKGVPRSIIIIIIISYHLICPPFLPDLRTVRFIRISEVKFYCIFEFSKLPFEPFFRDETIPFPAVVAFNNYATYVEVEIMFGAFGIARFRAEYCVTLETTGDEHDVTH